MNDIAKEDASLLAIHEGGPKGDGVAEPGECKAAGVLCRDCAELLISRETFANGAGIPGAASCKAGDATTAGGIPTGDEFPADASLTGAGTPAGGTPTGGAAEAPAGGTKCSSPFARLHQWTSR